jgi:hypothetical protein
MTGLSYDNSIEHDACREIEYRTGSYHREVGLKIINKK